MSGILDTQGQPVVVSSAYGYDTHGNLSGIAYPRINGGCSAQTRWAGTFDGTLPTDVGAMVGGEKIAFGRLRYSPSGRISRITFGQATTYADETNYEEEQEDESGMPRPERLNLYWNGSLLWTEGNYAVSGQGTVRV